MRSRAVMVVVVSGALAVALAWGEHWREIRGKGPSPASAAILGEPARHTDPPSGRVTMPRPRVTARGQRARSERTAALSLVLLLVAAESHVTSAP